jgi:hypothetical protein
MSVVHIDPSTGKVKIDNKPYKIVGTIYQKVIRPTEIDEHDPGRRIYDTWPKEKAVPLPPGALTSADIDRLAKAHLDFIAPLGHFAGRILTMPNHSIIIRQSLDFHKAPCDCWGITVRSPQSKHFRLTFTFLTSLGLRSALENTDYNGLTYRPIWVSERLMLASYSGTGKPVDSNGGVVDKVEALLVFAKLEADYQSDLEHPPEKEMWPKLTKQNEAEALRFYDYYCKNNVTGMKRNPEFSDCWASLDTKLIALGVESHKHLERLAKTRTERMRKEKKRLETEKRRASSVRDP